MTEAGGTRPARVFDVDAASAGARLDAFVAARLAVSRAEARWLLARGAVRLEGRLQGPGDKGARLERGARVEVAAFTPRRARRARPQPELEVPVLKQGEGWLALDKPPGVPVHPREEEEGGTLLNFAIARHPEMQGVGEGGLRSGVVHRLDLDTSGAVLLATREATWRRLRWAFRCHRVAKRYRAIALGSPAERGRADVGLVVARHRPAFVKVVEPDDEGSVSRVRRGRLRWRVVERLPEACLVEVDLETGFLHQIRATLAHLGAPLAGDRVYGHCAAQDPSGAPRQMLHAARLAFEEIQVESPDPPGFRAVLARLRG